MGGIFIQEEAGRLSISYIWALVGFSDTNFADVEVRGGVGASSASLWWIWSFCA